VKKWDQTGENPEPIYRLKMESARYQSDPADTRPGSSNSFRGMLLMAMAMLMIPAIDVFAKLLGQTMSPGQVVWYRFFVQSILITPVILYLGEWRISPETVKVQVARGVLIAAATLFFFAALNYLSIAAAISIFFIEPMVLTILSVVFLGEIIRMRRIFAILAGFAGALIVIRPSFAAVGLPALLPLATAVCFAFYVMLTRTLTERVNPFQMQWMVGISALTVMSIALILGETFGIATFQTALPEGVQIAWVIGLGLIATIGHLLLVLAVRDAATSLLAPFQYLEIIGATVFGYLVFSNIPDMETIIGVMVIIASGLYLFHRESVNARENKD